MTLLHIKNLHANVEDTPILKGMQLKIEQGACHVLMGPNGAGKSTLSQIIVRHPSYEVAKGEILFLGENLLELDTEEIARKGVFVSFQHPPEIPGVSNAQFLFSAYNEHRKAQHLEPVEEEVFTQKAQSILKDLGMKESFLERNLNEGFSGGEKKKNEIFQMLLFSPKLAILDEIDSGLDLDALKAVAKGLKLHQEKGGSALIITHYPRFLEHLNFDCLHIMKEGKIVHQGDKSTVQKLEEKGYEWT